MNQLFHRSSNTIAKVSLFGSLFAVAGVAWMAAVISRSSYVTQVGVAREQPVPFSHKHHVSGLGIDCRYCHTTAEETAFAGIPPTQTCMSCHSEIWSESPMLEPVRESYRTGRSLEWVRVHDLPDFVYFDHSIHLDKGIDCGVCHGAVENMPLTWREASLQMEWCLDCHRSPQRFLRTSETLSDSSLEADGVEMRRDPAKRYPLRRLDDCSICHR